MRYSGYERTIIEEHPQAVRWWCYLEIGTDFVFARGGRVKTCRIARREIRACGGLAAREWLAEASYSARTRMALGAAGELVPINRSSLRRLGSTSRGLLT